MWSMLNLSSFTKTIIVEKKVTGTIVKLTFKLGSNYSFTVSLPQKVFLSMLSQLKEIEAELSKSSE
jgi:hypothetical protein